MSSFNLSHVKRTRFFPQGGKQSLVPSMHVFVPGTPPSILKHARMTAPSIVPLATLSCSFQPIKETGQPRVGIRRFPTTPACRGVLLELSRTWSLRNSHDCIPPRAFLSVAPASGENTAHAQPCQPRFPIRQ